MHSRSPCGRRRLARALALALTALALVACRRDAAHLVAPDATSGEASAATPAPSPDSTPERPAPADPALSGDAPRAANAADFAARDFNLVFVSLTNTRADHLGAYGYARPTSPAIDRLAADAVVFENVFTHASWTLPAVVSLLTSTYPFTHGLMNRKDATPLPAATPTFVDVLEQAGYRTAAFVGDRDYSREFGHISRFDHIDDEANPDRAEDWKQYGVLDNTLPPALAWLRAHRDERFFVLLQGYDTHCPFAVPEANDEFDPGYDGGIDFAHCYWTFRPTAPVRTKDAAGGPVDAFVLQSKGDDYDVLFYPRDVHHMVALYDGEIRRADDRVRRLLAEIDTLGLRDRTIVVFFSDHGDMFGKHGRFMRGGPLRGTFYDDVLRVPLIVRHPLLPPARIAQLAEVIDIAPTLLDMLGLEAPAEFRGRSLRPAVLESREIRARVFAGSAYTPEKGNRFFRHESIVTAVRERRWKLIHEKLFSTRGTQDAVELFDVDADPDELVDLSSREPERVRELRRTVEAWLEEIGATDFAEELAR